MRKTPLGDRFKRFDKPSEKVGHARRFTKRFELVTGSWGGDRLQGRRSPPNPPNSKKDKKNAQQTVLCDIKKIKKYV